MTFLDNSAKMAQTLETVADGLREFEDKFWKPVLKNTVASFEIPGTMSLQEILLNKNMQYALAIGLSALHKAGGMLTGHFRLNVLILLSSSPKVKNCMSLHIADRKM